MTSNASDTVEIRAGEEVPIAPLVDWMRTLSTPLVPDGATVSVRQYPAGYSNLTYLVTVVSGSHERRFVLRRPPRGVGAGIAHDVGREHDILAALHPLGVPVPMPIARCDDVNVIGAPFFLMEHVDGVILRHRIPDGVASNASAREGLMREISSSFVRTLGQLHAVRAQSNTLAWLARPGDYVERQVQGWRKRWEASRTEAVPSMERLAEWLDANRPRASQSTLVHNDFKFDNLVLDASGPLRIVAILDWEMATVGDPLMDLGTTLAYWIEAGDAPVLRALGLGITTLPGAFTRVELVNEYARETGRDVSGIGFYHAFGLFKVAVIAQQIYARFIRGTTADPRFERLIEVVKALGASAELVASK